jgi:hypothetical protein
VEVEVDACVNTCGFFSSGVFSLRNFLALATVALLFVFVN